MLQHDPHVELRLLKGEPNQFEVRYIRRNSNHFLEWPLIPQEEASLPLIRNSCFRPGPANTGNSTPTAAEARTHILANAVAGA